MKEVFSFLTMLLCPLLVGYILGYYDALNLVQDKIFWAVFLGSIPIEILALVIFVDSQKEKTK